MLWQSRPHPWLRQGMLGGILGIGGGWVFAWAALWLTAAP